MIMQLLVAGACGVLIGFSFYLGSKIVNKYFKRLEKSQWKNFVSFSIGSIIVVVLSLLLFYIFLKPKNDLLIDGNYQQKEKVESPVVFTNQQKENVAEPIISAPNKSSVITKPESNTSPTDNNLDSTCLSFYEKMKTLDILPTETTPTYTIAEQQAIQDAYVGNYNPNIQNVFAKQREAKDLYLNTIEGNATQKESLATKYGFCYEYLSKKYGFIIN